MQQNAICKEDDVGYEFKDIEFKSQKINSSNTNRTIVITPNLHE